MIWVYLDESGEHDRATGHLVRLTLGGCIAPSQAWDALSEEWERELKAVGISMFHMKDFEADQGEFRGWKANRQAERERLLNALLGLIARHTPTLVGFPVFTIGDSLRKTYGHLLETALIHCLHVVPAMEGGPVVIMLAEHPEYPVSTVVRHFKEIGKGDSRLRTIAAQEPLDLPALQAADIVAYELSKRQRQNAKDRYPWRRLMELGCRYGFVQRGPSSGQEAQE